MKLLILAATFFGAIALAPNASASSPHDVVALFCIKSAEVQTADDMLDALAFLTYAEGLDRPCSGHSTIDFIAPSRGKAAAEIAVGIFANCSEMQTRLIDRIKNDSRFAEGSLATYMGGLAF